VIQLPLIAEVQAVLPTPERERPILAGVVLVEERAEKRGLTREWNAEQEVGI